MHQAGYPRVLAVIGSWLSDVQEKILRECFPFVVLMLDGDEAGREATRDISARLIKELFINVVHLPDRKQPDQLSPDEIDFFLKGTPRKLKPC
jgi:DNA primase